METIDFEITVLNDIRERLGAITDEQCAWAERRIGSGPNEGEKVIGEVTNARTQRLWALSMVLKAESDLENARGKMEIDQMVSDDHMQRHAMLEELSDVARAIFWAQAKTDLGYYSCNSTGLRKDWNLVEVVEPRMPSLSGIIGPYPGGLKE